MTAILMTACQSQKQPASENLQAVDRVEVAITEKQETIRQNLAHFGLQENKLNVLFVAFKDLEALQLFAKNNSDERYKLIKTFPICKRSGILGPKKAEGDKQVPEGFYHINRFNPQSIFHLSLGLNYPNELDKSLGYTGSDIFIHGACETVGCLPMTDDLIKEIYLYALTAKNAGQENIPVYIFPFEMTEDNINSNGTNVEPSTISFWKNLKEGYDQFYQNHHKLKFEIANSRYVFQ